MFFFFFFFFLMIRRPPRSTQSRSSAASDVYKRQVRQGPDPDLGGCTHARGGALHGGRGGHLLGRSPALGSARGAGGSGGAGVRVPARGLLPGGRDRRGSA